MLDKLGGIWAPRPSTGPHKLRECMPLIILLRNRLKYALTGKEVKYILMQRLVKVDGKARTDKTYPTGFMGACGDEMRVATDVRATRSQDLSASFSRSSAVHSSAPMAPVPGVGKKLIKASSMVRMPHAGCQASG